MENVSQTDSCTDVVELCALLQCLGFAVKSLDTSDGNLSQEGVSRTVVVNCQSSGLHVVLESGSLSCSCPATDQQNSGFWQVSGITGGKQSDKESGSTLLGTLPKAYRERMTRELREMVRFIKDNNESFSEPKEVNKSASMVELGSPEKRIMQIKAETPTRYRSLDTLTSAKDEPEPPLPAPRALQKMGTEPYDNKKDFVAMVRRQSTYTISSTPGNVRRRNKTSSPISAPQNNVLESLRDAEKAAIDLKNKLAYVIRELMEESRDDSSMSSLVLDVSKISVLKGEETSKAQFASSPNLSRLSMVREDQTKSGLKRVESVSTSNLTKPSTSNDKISRLKRLSPNLFKLKKDSSGAKSEDGKTNKLQSLFKSKIVTPVRPKPSPNTTPNLSSSKKKFSHVKSTIPRLSSSSKKE